MKTLIAFLFSISVSQAHDGHVHHAKHNFLLFGDERYASHLVYKDPHHYQILLELKLDGAQKSRIAAERSAHPGDLVVFLLDPLDLKKLSEATLVTGGIYRLPEEGPKVEVIPAVALNRERFKVIYFDELPLSLSAGS